MSEFVEAGGIDSFGSGFHEKIRAGGIPLR